LQSQGVAERWRYNARRALLLMRSVDRPVPSSGGCDAKESLKKETLPGRWPVKNCKAGCISSRLAGYWEKFSISNNRASDEPHWLR